MNIIHCSDYEDMSQRASHSVHAALRKNPDQLLCPASGNSGIGVYANLALACKKDPQNFRQMRILMLDEWFGLPSGDPNSCNNFIQKHLIQPLSIPEEHYIYFKSDAQDPEKECKRMDAVLKQEGPIDLCILGIGKNGHLGFNEPAQTLSPHCHVATLSEASREHSMTSGMNAPPEFGLTLGIEDILASRKIILLLTGAAKRNAIEEFLSKKVTPRIPASLLWNHPNVECYWDRTTVTGLL